MSAEGVFVDTASLETVVYFLSVFEHSATGIVKRTENQSALLNPDDLSFHHFLLFFISFFFLKAAFYCTARFCLVKKKLSGVFEGKNVKILLAPITIYFFSP